MNYPLDKTAFRVWVKQQSPQKLVDLKIVLLASQADLQIQLQNNNSSRPNDWTARARIKLRLTEWRLQVVEVLLSGAFQQAAYYLLDRDTYDTILEAANAARIS